MKKTIVLLTLCLSMPYAAHAALLNMNNVGADANWVVHADLDQFRSTDFGKLIETRLDEVGIGEKLENFAKVFSFNPLNDVRDVTIYGQDKDEQKTAILISGSFDQEKLLALLHLNPDYGEEVYEDIILRKWSDEKKDGKMMYGCFYTDGLIVMSSGEGTAKRAIDVLKGNAAHADVTMFNQPALSDDSAFVRIAVRNFEGIAKAEKQPIVMKQIQSLYASAGESGQQFRAGATLEVKSVEAAQGISKMIEGFAALAVLSGEENNRLSEIAKKVTITCEGNVVQIRLSDSPQAIAEMIAENIKAKNEKK